MNLKARTLAAAFALAALASTLCPAAAFAAGHHRAHHHAEAASYPMKADEFRKLMEKRIDAVRAAIDRKLERRGVSPERRKAIHKVFDEASNEVRAEIARRAAGGTVTHADAEKVKALASGLRTRVRERLRAERDPKLRAKLARAEAKRKERAAEEATRKKIASTSGDARTERKGGPPPRGRGEAEGREGREGPRPSRGLPAHRAHPDREGAGDQEAGAPEGGVGVEPLTLRRSSPRVRLETFLAQLLALAPPPSPTSAPQAPIGGAIAATAPAGLPLGHAPRRGHPLRPGRAPLHRLPPRSTASPSSPS